MVDQARGERGLPGRLLGAIAFLSAISAVSTDLYLPSFPQMADDLGTDQTGVQLTLTAFLVGVAVGQLLLGPLSDRFGRRPPLVAGVLLCAVAAGVAVFAPSVGVLIAARFVQGAAGAAGMVIGRAMIADLTSGRAAARAFSLNMTIAGVAPIVAPVLGGVLAAPLGWRGVLAVVFGLTVLMVVVVLTVVPETHPADRRRHLRDEAAAGTGESALRQLRSRRYLGNALISGFVFAALMSYVASSPFLYQGLLVLSPSAYGAVFAGNSIALVGSTFVSARLTRRRPPRAVLRVGLALMAVAVVVFAVTAVTGGAHLVLAASLFVMLAGFGLVQGNAVAAAITAVPRASGTASALLGAGQFTVGAAASALVGVGHADPAVSLALVIVPALAVAGVGFAVSHPKR
jgi:DHA1 family bicyclomycin/chloramphenicol resistance-like MFS transporter